MKEVKLGFGRMGVRFSGVRECNELEENLRVLNGCFAEMRKRGVFR